MVCSRNVVRGSQGSHGKEETFCISKKTKFYRLSKLRGVGGALLNIKRDEWTNNNFVFIIGFISKLDAFASEKGAAGIYGSY